MLYLLENYLEKIAFKKTTQFRLQNNPHRLRRPLDVTRDEDSWLVNFVFGRFAPEERSVQANRRGSELGCVCSRITAKLNQQK